jgi:hypothetical protein
MSAAENDEVVSIVHDMSAKHLTAFLLPPVPEEAVHIAVGEQCEVDLEIRTGG